jgi:hypothetical protein
LAVGFAGLGWWQWTRANDGNMLSWGYMFEWPLFSLFTVFLWVREVRAELRQDAPTPRAADEPPPLSSPFASTSHRDSTDTADEPTASYNRYLAWLADHPDRRPNQYPG